MKKFIALSIIGLCLGFASPLWAEDGDVGSKVCGQLQFAAQMAISTNNIANHGLKVRTAANLVSPFVDSDEITEECSTCIITQIARRVPIVEQERCGVVCPCDYFEAVPRSLGVWEAGVIRDIGHPVFDSIPGPPVNGCRLTNREDTTFIIVSFLKSSKAGLCATRATDIDSGLPVGTVVEEGNLSELQVIACQRELEDYTTNLNDTTAVTVSGEPPWECIPP